MGLSLVFKTVEMNTVFIFQDSDNQDNIIKIEKTYIENGDKLSYRASKFDKEGNKYDQLGPVDTALATNALLGTNLPTEMPKDAEVPPGEAVNEAVNEAEVSNGSV